jgi:hypothetical protein
MQRILISSLQMLNYMGSQKMNNKYAISASYYAGTMGDVTLPDGKTWDDISDWFIKWDTIYIEFEDGTKYKQELNSETLNIVDWKRPINCMAYETDKDGEPNWDKEIDID